MRRIHPRPRERLSSDQARRVALAAQGFGKAAPMAPVQRRDVARTVRGIGLLQIDSVNVLVRSHYLPLYSRLGPYDRQLLDDAAYDGRRRQLFEYWGHEASLIPVELQPLLRWRMQRAHKNGDGVWGSVARFGKEHASFCRDVLAQIVERGPLGVSDLATGGKRQGSWWGWSQGKVALEWLFWTGQVTTHSRRRFERLYDLPERVLPARVLSSSTPAADEAQRELLRIAIRAQGVATERDLRDYFRLPATDTKLRIAELVAARELLPVTVEGWRSPAYVTPDLVVPRRVDARALLSPFDSLVWFRDRLHRLFDFHYRIEIYTPAHKRLHGYYVLPFLLGDRLVARVDLKADRTNGRLLVPNVHFEPWAERVLVAGELDAELTRLAGWLGLDRDARDWRQARHDGA
jgi:uncharacterized protein YcaQ